jgi:hypothetical protein
MHNMWPRRCEACGKKFLIPIEMMEASDQIRTRACDDCWEDYLRYWAKSYRESLKGARQYWQAVEEERIAKEMEAGRCS